MEADKDPNYLEYSSTCLGFQNTDLKTLLPTGDVAMGDYDRAFKPYLVFVKNFLRNAVQRRFFDRNKIKFALGDYVSIADEAFALLTIYNNWLKWNDMAANDKWDKSQVKSEYTQVYDKNKKVKNIEWTSEGIDAYNEYYNVVEAYRQTENYKLFERYYLQTCVAELSNDEEGGEVQLNCPQIPRPKARRELLTLTSNSVGYLGQVEHGDNVADVTPYAC